MAALFKAGGYKSYRNYQSRAKDAHIAAGFEVTPELERMLRLCRKAVIRGLAGLFVPKLSVSKGFVLYWKASRLPFRMVDLFSQ